MKKINVLVLLIFISGMAFSQTKIYLIVGGNTMKATLVENEATHELKQLLENGPVNIIMNDYGGFEKVGTLPQSFTTSDTHITTDPGDIMLYQGNKIVVFYGSNSWSYTRLGKTDDTDVSYLKQFLGDGEIYLTLSLEDPSAIDEVLTDRELMNTVYDLKGNRITENPLPSGTYIIDGKTTLISR